MLGVVVITIRSYKRVFFLFAYTKHSRKINRASSRLRLLRNNRSNYSDYNNNHNNKHNNKQDPPLLAVSAAGTFDCFTALYAGLHGIIMNFLNLFVNASNNWLLLVD
jgi:hypothetical protein